LQDDEQSDPGQQSADPLQQKFQPDTQQLLSPTVATIDRPDESAYTILDFGF
jgi:hypothetical protein